MPLDLRICPHCGVQVLPMENGECPACRGLLAGAPAKTIPDGLISPQCPRCGSHEFRPLRNSAALTFVPDRICTQCQCIYRVPTPRWAAAIFIVIGILLSASMAVSAALRLAHPGPALIGLLLEIPLIVVGVLAITFGLRSLRRPAKKP